MEQDFLAEKKPKNRKWYVWLFIAVLCALLLSNMAGETFKNLFYSLLGGITPILIGLVVAFLLIAPVNWIENKLLRNAFVGNPHAKGYKRAISLTICYVFIIGLVILLMVLIIPNMVSLVQLFTEQGDTYLNRIQVGITEFISSLPWFNEQDAQEMVNAAVNGIVEAIQAMLPDFLSNIMTYLMDTVSILLNIVIGLILSFLLLKDKELIAKTSRRYTYAYNDRKKADEIVTITRRSHSMLNQFVICNVIVMFVIFVIAWIGYEIIGVPYAPLMALILGVLSIIPYIGGFVAAVPLVLVMLVFSSVDLLLIALIFGIVDWALVTTFLPPFIISKRLNMRAIVTMSALIIGGALFGVIGMILSAPVAAVISVVMQERLEVGEARREREELVASGAVSISEVGTSDILDLSQDADVNIFVPKEEREFKLKFKRKSNDINQLLNDEESITTPVVKGETKRKLSRSGNNQVKKTTNSSKKSKTAKSAQNKSGKNVKKSKSENNVEQEIKSTEQKD